MKPCFKAVFCFLPYVQAFVVVPEVSPFQSRAASRQAPSHNELFTAPDAQWAFRTEYDNSTNNHDDPFFASDRDYSSYSLERDQIRRIYDSSGRLEVVDLIPEMDDSSDEPVFFSSASEPASDPDSDSQHHNPNEIHHREAKSIGRKMKREFRTREKEYLALQKRVDKQNERLRTVTAQREDLMQRKVTALEDMLELSKKELEFANNMTSQLQTELNYLKKQTKEHRVEEEKDGSGKNQRKRMGHGFMSRLRKIFFLCR